MVSLSLWERAGVRASLKKNGGGKDSPPYVIAFRG